MKYLVRTIVMMARHGETAAPIKEVCERIYSNETSMILRRDLAEHHPAPPPKITLTLRALQSQDFPSIIKERPRRLPILLARIPSCYVAVTETGELAFMLWVIFNAEWARFRPYFKGQIHSPLQSDECLFEFAYTFEKFRGKGVMGAALVMIAEQVVSRAARGQMGLQLHSAGQPRVIERMPQRRFSALHETRRALARDASAAKLRSLRGWDPVSVRVG